MDDLTDLFKTFGSVKDIRSSSKKGHRFVEFYDVRTAEKAHASSSKEPLELFGRNLNVEYSRPKPQSITPHGGAAMTPFTPGPASEYMYTENAMLLHPMSPPPFSNAIPGPAVYVSPVPGMMGVMGKRAHAGQQQEFCGVEWLDRWSWGFVF